MTASMESRIYLPSKDSASPVKNMNETADARTRVVDTAIPIVRVKQHPLLDSGRSEEPYALLNDHKSKAVNPMVVSSSSNLQMMMMNSTDARTMVADLSTNVTLMEVILALRSHPLTRLQKGDLMAMTLEDQLLYMQTQPECKHVPIFTSMANVFSNLYWQL